MEQQNQFKCSGDCIKCHPSQRAYCSAQFTYNTMRMVEDMQKSVNDLQAKIEAIQNSEAHVFNPAEEKSENPILPIAQEGSGVVE